MKALQSKLRAASDNSTQLLDAYEDLTESMDEVDVAKWRQVEADAMRDRGDALKIFDLAMMKGLSIFCSIWSWS